MKAKRIILRILGCLLLFVGTLACFSARWYRFFFGGQSMTSLIFTLFSGIGGVEPGIVTAYVRQPLLLTLACTGCITLFCCLPDRVQLRLLLKKSKKQLTIFPVPAGRFFAFGLIACILLTALAVSDIELLPWLQSIRQSSTILDDYYVEPRDTKIEFPGQKRNLVYIYLESMETSFFSREQGGSLDSCVIPELYALAEENTNFSRDAGVGGWGKLTGGTWTTGALVTQIGGIPLLSPMGANHSDRSSRVLPGAALLWDLLAEQGYYQVMMIGSDKNFSDQIKLVEQHGIDRFYDYTGALEDGFLPSGYQVWWGMEDAKLYEYAKQELTSVSRREQPFSFTLFTIDTHTPAGYLCEKCGGEYSEQYQNVYACASRQAAEFVEWLKQQPFYENTTVILCGDHLSMDADYIRRNNVSSASRQVYNCIINSAVDHAEREKNRPMTALDMFPTTLAALGCRIEGDRLALGTNLYSDLPTLAEIMGEKTLNQELVRATFPCMVRFSLEPGTSLPGWARLITG